MSDTPPNTGPSHETLANLKAMMPSFIKGLKKKKIIGKGVVPLVLRPRKVCKVCGLLYDKTMLKADADLEIIPEFCATCKPLLDEGYTAFVCGDQYAIVRSERFSNWSGQIVQVSPNVMEALDKECKLAKRRINGANREFEDGPSSET